MALAQTVFITGGGSGIGMGLAAAFHARGATVIIAGRTRSALDAVAAKHPGMLVEDIDVADPESVAACAGRVTAAHPQLTTVINNAGVQQMLDFTAAPLGEADIAREIDINLKGLIRVSNAFLPLLRRQPTARLVHVGSGLAYVPLAAAPIYSATKAAVHSFTQSLRHQLRQTNVKVIEIVPPAVATQLHRGQSRQPPGVIPLDAFIKATMAGLDKDRAEIAVGLARVLRTASRAAPGLFARIVNKPR